MLIEVLFELLRRERPNAAVNGAGADNGSASASDQADALVLVRAFVADFPGFLTSKYLVDPGGFDQQATLDHGRNATAKKNRSKPNASNRPRGWAVWKVRSR